MTPTVSPRPRPGVMLGLTHSQDGTPLIRPTKSIRVGIGIPKGPAVLVFIDGERSRPETWLWKIHFGKWVPPASGSGDPKFQMVEVFSDPSPAEVESFYRKHRHEAQDPGYPRKIPFFTFTKKSVIERKPGKVEEFQEPDFNSIAIHGPKPTEIDILLMDENPLLINEFAMYSASEKQCYGDGEIGMRLVTIAKGAEEKKLAEAARAAGDKYFPITNGCFNTGCPYRAANACKPSQTLAFQFMQNPAIGVTPFFTTTAIRSSWQISSFIAELRQYAGSVAWKAVKLVVAPFRSNHVDEKTGKAIPATQWAVHMEMRGEDINKLRLALRSGWDDDAPMPNAITAAVMEDDIAVQSASEVAAEFYTEDEDEAPAQPAAAAPSRDKLRDAEDKAKKATAPAAEVAPAVVQTPAAAVTSTSTPVATLAPAANTTPSPTPAGDTPRWPDRRAMNAAIGDLKGKLGEIEFSKALKEEGGIMVGSLSHTDAKSSKFVDALQKRYVELQGRTEAPAPAVAAPPSPAPVPAAAAPPAPPSGDRLF